MLSGQTATTLLQKDFVYSWQRTVDPKTASQYAFLFDGIENAKAITDSENQLLNWGQG